MQGRDVLATAAALKATCRRCKQRLATISCPARHAPLSPVPALIRLLRHHGCECRAQPSSLKHQISEPVRCRSTARSVRTRAGWWCATRRCATMACCLPLSSAQPATSFTTASATASSSMARWDIQELVVCSKIYQDFAVFSTNLFHRRQSVLYGPQVANAVLFPESGSVMASFARHDAYRKCPSGLHIRFSCYSGIHSGAWQLFWM